MRRLRFLFAFFALVLIAPVGLLVQRSLHSIDLERRTRQQTVAERIFDEMERSLSGVLDEEEQRPTGDYRSATNRSDPTFVVERFQIEAGTNRFRPKAERIETEEAFDGRDGDEKRKDSLDSEVVVHLRQAQPEPDRNESGIRQAPGTTVRLNDATVEQKSQPGKGAKQKRDLSEYDALRSLNKALERRAVGRSQAPAQNEGWEGGSVLPADDAPAPSVSAAIADLHAGTLGHSRMSGRAISSERMALYRTVALGSTLYQQGLLIDVSKLGIWLRDRSIGGIPYASVEFFTGAAGEAHTVDPGTTSYRHRFAPPFASISAYLQLRPLGSRDSGLYVKALSATLIAATLIGLGLLYRTVSVTVRFAERRSNFVAAVSHELKTPLTAIRMYGEMLRDGVVPSEAKRAEYYRHITNESERLSRLIDNVLEYAKLEKGERRLELVTGSIAATIGQAAETMRRHAAEQRFDLTVEVAPDLPAVRFEADALMQVVWNLVDNAIKYARDSPNRRIDLRAERDGERVRVSVRDRGPGVEDRHLGEIFEPFYRSENELTRRSKGTGLGLALVRGLVDHMGATVEARNAADGGFIVELYFAAASSPDGTEDRDPA